MRRSRIRRRSRSSSCCATMRWSRARPRRRSGSTCACVCPTASSSSTPARHSRSSSRSSQGPHARAAPRARASRARGADRLPVHVASSTRVAALTCARVASEPCGDLRRARAPSSTRCCTARRRLRGAGARNIAIAQEPHCGGVSHRGHAEPPRPRSCWRCSRRASAGEAAARSDRAGAAFPPRRGSVGLALEAQWRSRPVAGACKRTASLRRVRARRHRRRRGARSPADATRTRRSRRRPSLPAAREHRRPFPYLPGMIAFGSRPRARAGHASGGTHVSSSSSRRSPPRSRSLLAGAAGASAPRAAGAGRAADRRGRARRRRRRRAGARALAPRARALRRRRHAGSAVAAAARGAAEAHRLAAAVVLAAAGCAPVRARARIALAPSLVLAAAAAPVGLRGRRRAVSDGLTRLRSPAATTTLGSIMSHRRPRAYRGLIDAGALRGRRSSSRVLCCARSRPRRAIGAAEAAGPRRASCSR